MKSKTLLKRTYNVETNNFYGQFTIHVTDEHATISTRLPYWSVTYGKKIIGSKHKDEAEGFGYRQILQYAKAGDVYAKSLIFAIYSGSHYLLMPKFQTAFYDVVRDFNTEAPNESTKDPV